MKANREEFRRLNGTTVHNEAQRPTANMTTKQHKLISQVSNTVNQPPFGKIKNNNNKNTMEISTQYKHSNNISKKKQVKSIRKDVCTQPTVNSN